MYSKYTKKVIHILSGGMDSTTLLYWLLCHNYDVAGVISFDYGQKHKVELVKAFDTINFVNREIAPEMLSHKIPYKVITLDFKGMAPYSALTGDVEVPHGHYEQENMKLTVVPNRNMAFLSLAAVWAISKSANLSLGVHMGDHTIYPDCREDFIKSAERAIRIGNWEAEDFRIINPFQHFTKGDIVKVGIKCAEKIGIDVYDIYINTHTCYEGKPLACGKCGACTERLEAFAYAGIRDPILYEYVQLQ
jgi:7-cyano-7-deazaguanine synthase